MVDRHSQLREFGRALRDARCDAGMTQWELALAIKYSGPAVSNWERGEFAPPIEVAEMIEEVLACGVGSLSNLLRQGLSRHSALPRDVRSAIDADPRLDDEERDLLKHLYERLTRDLREPDGRAA